MLRARPAFASTALALCLLVLAGQTSAETDALAATPATETTATTTPATAAEGTGLINPDSNNSDSDSSLRMPQRLTVGTADQFLGQLTPDGKRLIFVGNRNIVTEIYAQDVESGSERRLFDEGADVTWPRISPDGRHLLYISYREHAGGQLCLRDLPAGDNRRCLNDDTNTLQAEWIGNTGIVQASRRTIQANLHLARVSLDLASVQPLAEAALQDRNPFSPTLSPDGRWLVYVPVQRAVEAVGPGFAGRARAQLEALRLDQPDARPEPLTLDLPGQSGQPAFSPDGRWLYVVQFFTDSNGDGTIDANDSGVLFRLAFDSGKDSATEALASGRSDQLTSQARNCQYPAPAARALIATCVRDGSLSIFQLPPDGQVPAEWDVTRLRNEIKLVGRRADEALLYRQRLQQETRPRPRRLLMMRLARLHLAMEDFSAATYYARRMGEVDDPAAAGLEAPLLTQIRHRRALRADARGRSLAESEIAQRRSAQRQEAARLAPAAAPSAPAVVLSHVVRSEIAQDTGDFRDARRELDAATAALTDKTPRAVLEAWYERADAFYRLLDEREALAEAGRRLAGHPAFADDDQLDFANAAVRTLVRGLSHADADRLLARQQASATAGSAWAFALALGRQLNALHEERPPKAMREALFAFYEEQDNPLRRRVLVQEMVSRAAGFGADSVIELMATHYLDDTASGSQENLRALRLYRRAIMGRAYRRLDRQRTDEARADFDLVTTRTGSLEAAVWSINLRLRAGVAPTVIGQEVHTTVPAMAAPLAHFVKAYVIARGLPKLADEAHKAAVASAQAELRAAGPALRNRSEARALQGAIWHEDYLRGRNPASVERANRHYMVALDLVRNNPGYKAMLLGALGVLHTQVGNFNIALGYLEERDTLPYDDNAAGLAVSLARAWALLHVDRAEEAAATADRALAMLAAKPWLAERYGPLVQDRAAFYHLAAGHFERALALYDQIPASEAAPPTAATTKTAAGSSKEQRRNTLVHRFARSAAALGAGQAERALTELAPLESELAAPGLKAALALPASHSTPDQILGNYRLMAAGLRAAAHTQSGQLDAAQAALLQKRELLAARFKASGLLEDLHALVLIELQLAENAVDRKDRAQAAQYLDEALKHADRGLALARAPVDSTQLRVLWFAAQLHATGTALPFDVPARLESAHRALTSLPRQDPTRRFYPAWLDAYLALEDGRATPAPASATLPAPARQP